MVSIYMYYKLNNTLLLPLFLNQLYFEDTLIREKILYSFM